MAQILPEYRYLDQEERCHTEGTPKPSGSSAVLGDDEHLAHGTAIGDQA